MPATATLGMGGALTNPGHPASAWLPSAACRFLPRPGLFCSLGVLSHDHGAAISGALHYCCCPLTCGQQHKINSQVCECHVEPYQGLR